MLVTKIQTLQAEGLPELDDATLRPRPSGARTPAGLPVPQPLFAEEGLPYH